MGEGKLCPTTIEAISWLCTWGGGGGIQGG
jgi:hypothetical protein